MRSLRSFLLFLLAFTAVPVQASDLTLFGGVQRPGKLTLRSAVSGAAVLLQPRTFGTFGVRVSQGRVVGSEHTLAYSPNFLSRENSAFLYHSNFLVQIPHEIVRPYVTAGLGTFYVRGDGSEAVTGAKFAINYGGGVKVKLAGAVGVQVDARGYTLPSVLDERLNVLEVSAGVVFTF